MNLKNKKVIGKIIEMVYQTIFSLNDEDLLRHYEEVKKELIKRGVSNV